MSRPTGYSLSLQICTVNHRLSATALRYGQLQRHVGLNAVLYRPINQACAGEIFVETGRRNLDFWNCIGLPNPRHNLRIRKFRLSRCCKALFDEVFLISKTAPLDSGCIVFTFPRWLVVNTPFPLSIHLYLIYTKRNIKGAVLTHDHMVAVACCVVSRLLRAHNTLPGCS